jgi:lipopolysaccharide/colanic/teichoic acid biosynthesis glycosyltransferase
VSVEATLNVRVSGAVAAADFDAFIRARRRRAHRICDVLGAVALVVTLAPALLVIAGAALVTSGRPIIFRQTRRGIGGVEFQVLKFRSLSPKLRRADCEASDPITNIAPYPLFRALNDPRLTPLGRFLRRHYLDELPQLWNVLQGDMSLVGPRPLRSAEVASLPAEAIAVRETVRPGMTGLWQVDPRRYDSIEKLIELDRRYCATSTVYADIVILCRTLRAVLCGEGS